MTMLLRRIMQHVREQHWFAVGLDFLIVVTGVVIGFQFTNWNAQLQDHQKETLILERLHADFVTIENRSATGITELSNRSESARALAQIAIENIEDVEAGNFAETLSGSIGTLVPTGRSATYVELLTSGEMRLIRSEDLRLALVRFDEQVRRQELAYETLADMVIGDAGILLTTQSLNDAVNAASPPRYIDELERLRQSPEFLVAARLMVTVNSINHRWHSETHARAEAVLTVLNTENAP
jgi:hypothetical protein